jgi:hypothetical protein
LVKTARLSKTPATFSNSVAVNARILEGKTLHDHCDHFKIEKIQLTHLLLRLDKAENPILKTDAITYDPTLSAREQADKDLQDLVRHLSKKL